MTAIYIEFKKFTDREQAEELASVLETHGIEYELIDNSPSFDVAFSDNAFQKEVLVKIKQIDFEQANKILEEQANSLLDQFGKDHYLYAFTEEELLEILMKPDEWGVIDFKLARKILEDRGHAIDNDQIATFKEKRIEELSKPEKGQRSWIIAGYVLAIFGGFIGICIGWFLWKSQKTLPNGQKVHSYCISDQKDGQKIFVIGTVIFLVISLIRIINAT